jgi:alkylhydroperoxidase family enzyme
MCPILFNRPAPCPSIERIIAQVAAMRRAAVLWYKVGKAKQGGGTMPRVREIEEPGGDLVLTQIFEQERTVFGGLLNPTKVMAHCPPILRAAKLLGASIEQSGQLPKALLSLVNFRVASINGCPF